MQITSVDDVEAFRATNPGNKAIREAWDHGAEKCIKSIIDSAKTTDLFRTVILDDWPEMRDYYLARNKLYHQESLEVMVAQILLLLKADRDPRGNQTVAALLSMFMNTYRVAGEHMKKRGMMVNINDYDRSPEFLGRVTALREDMWIFRYLEIRGPLIMDTPAFYEQVEHDLYGYLDRPGN